MIFKPLEAKLFMFLFQLTIKLQVLMTQSKIVLLFDERSNSTNFPEEKTEGDTAIFETEINKLKPQTLC